MLEDLIQIEVTLNLTVLLLMMFGNFECLKLWCLLKIKLEVVLKYFEELLNAERSYMLLVFWGFE